MMNGYWQQSLTLYAQLLFGPAVNPQVEHSKQNRLGMSRQERRWEGGLCVTQGQSYCGLHLWLYTNNMDWESICHWIFHADNVCGNKCPHLAVVAQKLRAVQAFCSSWSSGSHIQSSPPPPLLNDQVTPYWSQPSFKAENLKPCVAHSMTCWRQ